MNLISIMNLSATPEEFITYLNEASETQLPNTLSFHLNENNNVTIKALTKIQIVLSTPMSKILGVYSLLNLEKEKIWRKSLLGGTEYMIPKKLILMYSARHI